jgi:hypothetical protein
MNPAQDSPSSLTNKVASILEILEGSNKSDRLKILKMVASQDSLSVNPVMALANLAGSQRVTARGNTSRVGQGGPAGGSAPNPLNQDPQVKDLKSRAQAVQDRMSAARKADPAADVTADRAEKDSLLAQIHQLKLARGTFPAQTSAATASSNAQGSG